MRSRAVSLPLAYWRRDALLAAPEASGRGERRGGRGCGPCFPRIRRAKRHSMAGDEPKRLEARRSWTALVAKIRLSAPRPLTAIQT